MKNSKPQTQDAGPVLINQVLWDELTLLKQVDGTKPAPALKEIYRQLGQPRPPGTRPLAALCFSGGGIRSATFNLGVTQALTKLGLLGEFDYVSSVSGGGYIAGWLRAWFHHAGNITDVAAALTRPAAAPGFNPLAPEPRPIDHLREYSNYLTPRLGFFSADTWALAAMLVRNLILNWLVLVPALAALAAIPQIALIVATGSPDPATISMAPYSRAMLWLAAASAMWSAIALHYFRRTRSPKVSELRIIGMGLVPLWLACLCLSTAALWRTPDRNSTLAMFSALWCVGIPLAGWLIARVAAGRQPHAPSDSSEVIGIVGSGVIVAVPFFAIARDLRPWLIAIPALFVVLAVPVLLCLYLLARALFVAFASLGERDTRVTPPEQPPTAWAAADREWWARCSGWVLLATTTWVGASALVVLGGYAFSKIGSEWHAFVAASGGISGLIAARLGTSPATKGQNDAEEPVASPVKDLLLKLMAPLAVALIVLLLSELTTWIARYTTYYAYLLTIDSLRTLLPVDNVDALWRAVGGFALVPLLLVGISWSLGWVVNVNRFSAHGLYRDRLMRAYLGASNTARTPDPFTGFDPGDDVQLHDLRDDGAPRPILVVNTTLNLVKSAERLAWQQRKAESFSMTPLYCGNFHDGYRPSATYGGPNGISLATAVTISGAAASPNEGYHSSSVVTFLMTLFNARLGCWLGNTNAHGAATFRQNGPSHAGKILFAELLGLTDAEHPYVNLSDGGHFENLGIYEMVLRRCRLIVASDAGQDPDHDFEDLGSLVRKVRIDFGVPITFDKRIQILPRKDTTGHGLACAVGRIGYDAVDPGASPGWLLYIKPTLLAPQGPPYDVVSWSRSSALFPHESTTDQWFSEAQFESYRALGESLVEQIGNNLTFSDLSTFIEAVHQNIEHPVA